jgi:ribosomal protein L10
VLNFVQFTENEKEKMIKVIRDVVKERKTASTKGGFFKGLL